MSAPGEMSLVLKTLEDSFKAHLNVVAATIWVVYDILLTVDQEVSRIWKHKISIPFMIYGIARYYGAFFLIYSTAVQTNDHVTNKFCKGWGPFEAFGVQLLSMIANALLAMRVYAFYNRGKAACVALVMLFLTETIAELVFSTMTGVEAGPSTSHPGGLPITGCLGRVSPRFGIAAWIINITYQLILFAVALFRLWRSTRTDAFHSNLMMTLVRDGALFFFMMFLANFVNIILNHVVDASPIVEAGVPWLIATFSVGVSRIILSLRGVSAGCSLTCETEISNPRVLAFARPEESNGRSDISTQNTAKDGGHNPV